MLLSMKEHPQMLVHIMGNELSGETAVIASQVNDSDCHMVGHQIPNSANGV